MPLISQTINEVRQKIIPPLNKEYLTIFQNERVNISLQELIEIIDCAFNNAVESFEKLELFKVYQLSAYNSYWIREELTKILTTRTMRKINVNKDNKEQDQDIKAIRNYFSILSSNLSVSVEQQIICPPFLLQREKAYNKYRSLFDSLKHPFQDLVQARNLYAQQKGSKDFVSFIRRMFLNRIPDEEYDFFIQNVDWLIDYLYGHLPKIEKLPDWFYSRYNQPCFLCLLPVSDYPDNEKLLEIMTGLYPRLKEFQQRININYSDKAITRYVKEKDVFEVNIRGGVNKRHQTIDLIHELGHVINFIDSFTNNIDLIRGGKYLAEKETLKITLNVLGVINPEILKAYFGDLLLSIRHTLFELAIYARPDQDYDLLYARLFRKCFPDSSQRSNSLYLLDQGIISKPLGPLIFTVASVSLMRDGNA